MKKPLLLIFSVCCLAMGIQSCSLFSSNEQASDPALHLIKLSDSDALCLDGSPGSYYISKDGDPKKIYLQFQGGGWCYGPSGTAQLIESCYERSGTRYGSSKNYTQTVTYHDGVLSANQQNNFKDWTRVLLKYCDGSGHQGTRANPIIYKGTKLYFRGHNITVAQLNALEKSHKLFSQATHVVVGGYSAGGLAAFTWTNYVRERVKVGKVWSLPDSGIFLDAANVTSGRHDYKASFKVLVNLVNSQIPNPVQQCVAKFPNQLQNCMFAQNLAPFIKTPLFVIQSLYDSWSIEHILNVTCVQDDSLASCNENQLSSIEEYHRNTTNAIFAMSSNSMNGFWAPVCSIHVFALSGAYYNSSYRIPANSQDSIMKSVQTWIQNGEQSNNKFIDLGKWPDNRPCAGKVQEEFKQEGLRRYY